MPGRPVDRSQIIPIAAMLEPDFLLILEGHA
jgi:hypothetical protein